MQAHIRREATRPSSRVPTSPRSRSAESVTVRKVREKPDLSTDGFGGVPYGTRLLGRCVFVGGLVFGSYGR